MRKTFSIISLGCPRNLVDSEHIIAEYSKKGYVFKEGADRVDTVIINTCGFIEDAKKESIDTMLKVIDAKKAGDIKKIAVVGCLSQRYGKELEKEFKEVDEFRGILDSNIQDRVLSLTPGHFAYLKISEGCKNRCTYCIIPYIKGAYRSRDIESIIKEAKTLLNKGVKEIVLVGQDTSLYGTDLYGRKRLAELLKELGKFSKDKWIRLLYCHPANLEKDVIKAIRDSKDICKYIDLPIEHISDAILKVMGRRIKKADIVDLIAYIRKEIPNVAIRTSLIVGFPGEKDMEFQELLDFIKETKFERLGIFRYSREEGTPAYKYKGHVSEKEKERRFNEAMLLQQSISRDINERFKGQTLKVLIDEKNENGYIGRSAHDAPEVDGVVYVKGKNLKLGNFYNVKIVDTYEYDLVGKLTAPTAGGGAPPRWGRY
ncbi:MAG: 30S ribosomal protein S12 methylthiotransferase RimO [Candidatus Omnitrophica bacterium]|nr:30S ribosomal protein S12 methylthiotransferase RimO [Candidatus Omnitrophota bacterium]MBU4457839.1 30S ribosomal protein S12 methylthiotransferase RimO [Candidatus Omnitrophota bacterium]